MAVSHARTAATLSTLGVVLVLMLVYGWKHATAAFPGSTEDASSQATACATPQTTTTISTKEVTVSVYNGSNRKGLADRTMRRLEAAGFKVGSIGNAPAGTEVDTVEVRVTSASDPAAALVAAQFDPPAKVVPAEDDLGPGPDVIMGKTSRLPRSGLREIKLAKPVTTCLDKPKRTPAS